MQASWTRTQQYDSFGLKWRSISSNKNLPSSINWSQAQSVIYLLRGIIENHFNAFRWEIIKAVILSISYFMRGWRLGLSRDVILVGVCDGIIMAVPQLLWRYR